MLLHVLGNEKKNGQAHIHEPVDSVILQAGKNKRRQLKE
jgi:hypothetical protein